MQGAGQDTRAVVVVLLAAQVGVLTTLSDWLVCSSTTVLSSSPPAACPCSCTATGT